MATWKQFALQDTAPSFDSLRLNEGGALSIYEDSSGPTYSMNLYTLDLTASRNIALPNDSGTIALTDSNLEQTFDGAISSPNVIIGQAGYAGSIQITSLGNDWGITFEGITADAFETLVRPIDPTADRTIEFPDDSGTIALTGTVAIQSFGGNVVAPSFQAGDGTAGGSIAVTSIGGTGGMLIFEGTTADAFETILKPTDPTADRDIFLPNASGTIMLTLADDSSPQLGADLDLSGYDIIGAGDILLVPTLETATQITCTYNENATKKFRIDTANDNATGAAYLELLSDDGVYNHLNNARSIIKDENDMTSDSAFHLATQQSIKKYVDDFDTNPKYFSLYTYFYNCCDLDGYIYFRDTNSQNTEVTAIGFLRWSITDTEDPSQIGDTVSIRMSHGAGGMGISVPVDCEFISRTVQWSNNSFVNADQNVYLFTTTPPNNSNSNFSGVLRDKWVVNQTEMGSTTANKSYNDTSDILTDEVQLGDDYSWNRQLDAGDQVILGFYSNDGSLGSPNVTGCMTYWFKMR